MNDPSPVQLPVPPHVPPGLVRDFDMYKYAPYDNLMESAEAVAARGDKIFFTPRHGGHWVVAGYQALANIVRDTDSFSNKPYTIPTYEEATLAPLLLDPPEHGKYRDVLTRIFTPRAAASLSEIIRSSASRLIDAVEDQGHCDFVTSVAELLPVSVFLSLMGLPLEKLKDYRAAVQVIMGSADAAEKRRVADWIDAELTAGIKDRQQTRRDDLISELLDADLDGRKPNFDEMINFCTMLFTAALDTVTVTLSHGIRHLAGDGQLQAWARENPGRVADLTEELMRRYSAAQLARTVSRNTEIDGVTLKKGDRVLLLAAAANLDPAMFDDPQRVDPDRPKKPHLAFGLGAHRCVGMHLARVELQIAYNLWLSRIPTFRVDPERPPRFSGGHVFSINSLWLRWD